MAASYWFEYGRNEALARPSQTAHLNLPGETRETAVTAVLPGLLPRTIYYVRVVASNGIGTSQGLILRFHSGEQQNPKPSSTLSGSTDATASQTETTAPVSADPPSSQVKNLGTKTTTGTTVSTQTATLEVTPGRSAPLVVSLAGFIEGIPATATCANLPEGATCSYDDKNQSVTITPSAKTPPGSYPVRVTFSTGTGVD
jgi:hypothetical protein